MMEQELYLLMKMRELEERRRRARNQVLLEPKVRQRRPRAGRLVGKALVTLGSRVARLGYAVYAGAEPQP